MIDLLNKIHFSDCVAFMKTLPDNCVDSIVTDPPYELGFMGKSWDNTGIANSVEMWTECLRVLKPGGYLLAFSGTRTYHRMACAIEDAGFEVRDMIEWVYGSGFPKSLNIGKAIDKLNGRKYEYNFEVAKYLKECRESKGITKSEVDNYLGTITLYSWYEGRPAGTQLPTQEHYNKLKLLFGLDDRFDLLIQRVEAEREVIGKHTTDMGGLGGKRLGTKGADITIAKLDEAKQYEGWGTALKPAHEPICMARKPLSEKTVAENCLKWGTGGINIDESRVESTQKDKEMLDAKSSKNPTGVKSAFGGGIASPAHQQGRFPANLIHDNSEEVRECFPNESERFFKSIIYQAKASKSERNKGCEELDEKIQNNTETNSRTFNDRCLTCKKKFVGSDNTICHCPPELKITDKTIYTNKNNHPTVKPIALMEYLIKMVTKEGGIVFDPFAGSGTTLVAAKKNGYQYLGTEMTKEYIPIIEARLNAQEEERGDLPEGVIEGQKSLFENI